MFSTIMPLKQRGQSLVLSLILMSFAAMTVLYSYNTSKLNVESTKLQHTADNTAYSVATIAARDFNFKAYTNRASVANQVAIAQMVGLSSWFNMTEKFAQNACTALCWVPYLGQVLSGIESVVGGINTVAQPIFEVLIFAENAILLALDLAQEAVHYAGAIGSVATAQEVVAANDDHADLDLMQNPLLINSVHDVWMTFQESHSRNDDESNKTQFNDFKAVILESRDPFSTKRSYKLGFPWSLSFFPIRWRTQKAGGSELVSGGSGRAETWSSMDTISFHLSRFKCSWSGCRWRGFRETELGWGSTRSDSRASSSSFNNDNYWGDSRDKNSGASNYADDEEETRGFYSGVQSFYGLSNSAFQKNHTDNIAVVVSKSQNELRTTSSVPIVSSNLNPAVDEELSGDRLTALSTAQAYYSRPRDLMEQYSGWARADSQHEYGNLYNPFWQSRLSESTTTERSVVLLLTEAL
ncbi:hypothetical protein L2735_04585 [Shewanella olleyana]|uniref:hypothetical protein n=1 Tax=Shewanella olleyana TaxID=135626 RepID=UPI002010A249|nr:hypothetical protein [Shewanella olleyana]MCL1066084.1 hypothetical protein [Shewanella olleyana]